MRKRQERLGEVGGFWLSRRANSPVWCRTWFDSATRQTCRTSLGTEDLDDAKLALAAWVMANGKMERQRSDAVHLETCLIRYFEHQARHLASAEPTRHGLAKWSEFFPGALVSEVTPEKQRQFVAWLRGKKLSNDYIRRILAVGQAALNRAHREGEITSAPAISLALAPEGDPRERLLTTEEAKALFDAAVEPHQTLYLMMAFGTAARPKAILELTTFQVDCDARLIRLNPPGRAQNKKRRPTLPICNTLLPYLRGLPAGPVVRYQGRALAGIKSTFDHLTERAARRIRQEAAQLARTHLRVRRRAEAVAALSDGRKRAAAILEISAYTIRHTIAAEMRKRGVAVWEVAGFLGHSSGYKTTERYAKFGPDHLGGATRAIDAYFADLRALGTRLQIPQPALRVSSVLENKKGLAK
jgi:integrase